MAEGNQTANTKVQEAPETVKSATTSQPINKRTIAIDLNEERDAYIVAEPENMVHLRERDLIWQRITESLVAAKKYDGKSRRHDTIMLAGVRGSGKTTFMLSILNFIENGKIGIELDGKKNAEREIESLQILDPTLIEDKTHIFINIISMIKAKVDEIAKGSNCFKNDDSKLAGKYKAWEKSFRKLAEGLPSIDGVGTDGFATDSWLDAEFVMDKGVRMAHAANNLEKAFHTFVSCSLDFIDKKAFILCFDDIDTNFGRGWPVLEVLHKYLTTPQLITILSGDPSLYSILIRDRQWSNFSDRLLEMEAKTKQDRQRYKEIIAHLEEQYFLKLLKPERRVFLNSLYQKEQHDGDNIEVIGKSSVESLQKCYDNLLRNFGIYSGGQQELFYRFLAATPLRTQKQLLFAFDNFKEYRSNLGNNILDIFWSDLAEKKVDVSNLHNAPHYTVPQIVSYLVRNKILIEGYTLTPLFSDHFINGAQFALGALLTESIRKNPSYIFAYWLRICLTRELGALMEGQISQKGQGPSIEDYVDYCAVNTMRTSRYVSRFATAYIRAYLKHQAAQNNSSIKASYDIGTWHGTLPLRGLASRAKSAKDQISNRIDAVFGKGLNFNKIMGYLPLSGSTDHKGQFRPVYSFYNLMGVLGEIVLVARSTEKGNAINEVSRTIVKNSQYREYPLPSWSMALAGLDTEFADITSDDTNSEQEGIKQIPPEFAEELVQWACYDNAELVVSPSVLGKIFTRFFYTTNNMDDELSTDKSLGNWMHRMVVVFLHSVVLVEAMEKLKLTSIRLDLKNPVKKDNIFINNLNNINLSDSKDELVFSKWLLTCPIWKLYMKDKFECPGLKINSENVFKSFAYTYDKVSKTYQAPQVPTDNTGPLHVYKLNNLLNEIDVNIYRWKDANEGSAPSKTNVGEVPPTEDALSSNNTPTTPTSPSTKYVPSQKPPLERFLSNIDNSRKVFLEKCQNENLTNVNLKAMSTNDILAFMKKHLRGLFTPRSLNKARAEKVRIKIANGEWHL